MIADCRVGKIDRIITKSISRFARNTLDCLNYVRELKGLGIGVTFEKEAIDTLDAKGEVLMTILSSLAQDESRNISENSTWGIRKRHNITRFSQNTEANPFSSKIICGECNRAFARKGWRTSNGGRKVWQCSERYKVKGVLGFGNRHIYEDTLIEIYLRAWNRLLECREMLMPEGKRKMQGEDLLAKFRAMDFMEVTKGGEPMRRLDIDLMLRTVDYIKVYENGMVVIVFLDGTEIECKHG